MNKPNMIKKWFYEMVEWFYSMILNNKNSNCMHSLLSFLSYGLLLKMNFYKYFFFFKF